MSCHASVWTRIYHKCLKKRRKQIWKRAKKIEFGAVFSSGLTLDNQVFTLEQTSLFLKTCVSQSQIWIFARFFIKTNRKSNFQLYKFLKILRLLLFFCSLLLWISRAFGKCNDRSENAPWSGSAFCQNRRKCCQRCKD